ncbi:MAG: hypothetical protein HYT39_02005 [Candidatus Sungbacteria bacterium]|nr:hypothetical protein [Candidatus Sungbacteria bacterium]
MSTANPKVEDLFKTAAADGIISRQTALAAIDYGAEIQAGLGIPPDEVAATEVVLLALLVDDSGSIRFAGNSQAVRDGVNGVLQALGAAKKQNDVLVLIELLNRGTLNPYSLLGDAKPLDDRNYNPDGSTPLFEHAVPFLATVIAKSQEFAANGVPCRTVSLIMTDGGDNSRRGTATEVARITGEMLRAENHIIFGYGVDDGTTDFQQVFADMGIPKQAVLISSSDPKEIRKSFQLFSQSAVRASQNAPSFSKVAMGGFAS